MAFDIGEAKVSALEFKRELFVINAKKMQESRLEVVDMNGVFDHGKAKLIPLAIGKTAFDAPAGHPDGERVLMMVPAEVRGDRPFRHGRAAEFAAPNDQGVVEQPSFL